jgi:hypothetical protein
MNPNSAHQLWSLWQYRVEPSWTRHLSFATVKANVARFGRLLFGSASEMRLHCATDGDGRLYWEITVRTEGHPVHDPQYVEWMHARWRQFLAQGFGATSPIRAHARLEAGDRQDGRPADQLIVMPALIGDR